MKAKYESNPRYDEKNLNISENHNTKKFTETIPQRPKSGYGTTKITSVV